MTSAACAASASVCVWTITTPPPQTLRIGETATQPYGQTVTVISIDYPNPAIHVWPEYAHPAGAAFAGVWGPGPALVGGTVEIGPANPFRVVLADHTQVETTTPFKEPAFPAAVLMAHACVRGWVGFAVPLKQPPVMLMLETRDTQTFDPIAVRWRVS